MKLLVTGGAGFIGSNFVHYWMKHHPQDHIAVLDKLTYAGHLENLASLKGSPNLDFIHGDICDFPLVKELVSEIDTIVHFAAETHVDRSLAGLAATQLFNRANIDGTLNLLQAALEVGGRRFHHVSTDEVYGSLPLEPTSLKFNENTPYNPHNPYSISKAVADFHARFYHHTYGLPVTISNCTNNYGPYQTPEKMIPRSIFLLLYGQKLKLYGEGINVRDWLHVEDHCTAIETILQGGTPGETYCIGGNSELSNYQLVQNMLALMSEITGQEMSMETHVETVNDRPGHDLRYAMDTTKIETELGWQRQHTFESGFRSTVEWYTSGEGRVWLESLAETSQEVREGQDTRKEHR